MNINDIGPEITEAELGKFEAQLRLSLPREYREFLLKMNGGSPSPRDFRFHDGRPASSVRYFFRLRGKERMRLLGQIMEMYRGRVSPDLLPIAVDDFGNLVCIGLVGGEYDSQVVFWDHEGEADEGEPPATGNLTLISVGFDVFLRDLYDEV